MHQTRCWLSGHGWGSDGDKRRKAFALLRLGHQLSAPQTITLQKPRKIHEQTLKRVASLLVPSFHRGTRVRDLDYLRVLAWPLHSANTGKLRMVARSSLLGNYYCLFFDRFVFNTAGYTG